MKLGNNNKKKKIEKIKVLCGLCKQETNHIITKKESIYYNDDEIGISTQEHRQIIKCCGCDSFSFRKIDWCSENMFRDHENIIDTGEKIQIFPKRDLNTIIEKNLYNTPHLLRKIYQEIIRSYNEKCYLLSVIGIRTLLEGICKQEKIEGKDLAKKINGLIEKKIITESIGKSLHGIRKIGNESTHELEELNFFEIKHMIEIIENILENIYELEQKTENVIRNKKARRSN